MTPSINPTASAHKAAAPQAATKPQPGQKPEFAQMLSEQQAMPEDAAPKAAEAPPEANRGDVREKAPAKGEKAQAKDAKAGKADDAESKDKADDAAATEETPTDVLQALQLTAQPEAAKPKAGGKGEAAEAEDGVEALAGKRAKRELPGVAGEAPGKKTQLDRGEGEVRGAGDDKAQLDASKAKAADAKADTAWQAAAERVASTEPAARRELPTVNAAGQLEHMAQPSRTAEAASVAQASVATPAQSPEFPQALGVQISVLAKGGVQQAELQLNPAEMGPISVRIALDGAQARVEFGADVAATRQIIENGLPQLAAAMRDAGITLSGGGVHSQARGREEGAPGQPQGGQGGSNGASNEVGETDVRRINTRVSAGGVDLYA